MNQVEGTRVQTGWVFTYSELKYFDPESWIETGKYLYQGCVDYAPSLVGRFIVVSLGVVLFTPLGIPMIFPYLLQAIDQQITQKKVDRTRKILALQVKKDYHDYLHAEKKGDIEEIDRLQNNMREYRLLIDGQLKQKIFQPFSLGFFRTLMRSQKNQPDETVVHLIQNFSIAYLIRSVSLVVLLGVLNQTPDLVFHIGFKVDLIFDCIAFFELITGALEQWPLSGFMGIPFAVTLALMAFNLIEKTVNYFRFGFYSLNIPRIGQDGRYHLDNWDVEHLVREIFYFILKSINRFKNYIDDSKKEIQELVQDAQYFYGFWFRPQSCRERVLMELKKNVEKAEHETILNYFRAQDEKIEVQATHLIQYLIQQDDLKKIDKRMKILRCVEFFLDQGFILSFSSYSSLLQFRDEETDLFTLKVFEKGYFDLKKETEFSLSDQTAT